MSGVTLKEGDRVVVTADNYLLRGMHCGSEIQTGSIHTILSVGDSDCRLDVETGPYIELDWIELYEDYADEDWV